MSSVFDTLQLTSDLANRYAAIRAFTLSLTETLQPDDLVAQSMPEASPAKWHLAHTTWFFEAFLLLEHLPGYRPFHPRFNYLFNSYYQQIGAMHARAERGLLTRPTIGEVLAYRTHVDEHMQRLIATVPGSVLAPRIILGLNHEQQHQELLLTDIKHLFSRNPLLPIYRELPRVAGAPVPLRFIKGEAGVRRVGHDGESFAFDNEGPSHDVLLQAHAIANRPTSNSEYRAFIEDGGYERSELWLSDGWAVVRTRGWQRPLYWQEDLASEFTLGGERSIDPHAPVSHLSFYEADAYARWAGCRLPTEMEWECWAKDAAHVGNFVDSGLLHPAAPSGDGDKLQVFGDVWEWTMSSYAPYPGYRPSAGAIGEYNGKFMCNQMVLRGGSCATHSTHIRASYRNFFYPGDRWQFSGVRLAKDVT